jgi:hypothetical protein
MMRRFIAALGLALMLVGTLSGCVVREQRVATGPRGCPGGFWVEGHYGPRGRWHQGHWRCPGVVERIEID